MSHVGVGLPKIWQLREDHPFYQAAKIHDAAYDAAFIFSGKKTLEDVKGELYPPDYSCIINQKLNQLRWLESVFCMDERKDLDVVKYFIGRADVLFEVMCKKAANNYWLHMQALVFCRLVKTYSFFKFRF